MDRKIGQVSFSLKDPFESELLEHTRKFPNFSGYIKRLIQNDMYDQQAKITPTSPTLQNTPINQSNIDSDMMKGFM